MGKRVRLILMIAAVVSLAGLPGGAAFAEEGAEELLRDDWYAAYLGGQRIGHANERAVVETGPDGVRYRTTVRQEFAIGRGEHVLRFLSETVILEDTEGQLLEFEHTQQQGPTSQITKGRVEGDELIVRAGASPRLTETRLPVPDGISPEAQRRLRRGKGFEPGTSYSIDVFVPEFVGHGVTVDVEVGAKEEVEVFGVTRILQRIESRLSVLPGLRPVEWVDAEGNPVLVRVPMAPGMDVELRLTTRAAATAPTEEVDIMALAVIRPEGVIERPEAAERVRLLVKARDGRADLSDIPEGPHQSVERTPEGAVVTVTRARPPVRGGYTLPYDGRAHEHLLRANRWLEVDDALIQELSREALDDETDPARAAARIESFVAAYIEQKDLSLGMATAAEAARHRTGDCTEHAMLAAALARAAGMPARVVNGLAYVPMPGEGGLFGYHSWTEVYVGEWLPIDSALGGHSATHMALGRTDLNSPGSLSDMTDFIPFIGRIDIEILEVSYATGRQGRARFAPAGDEATGLTPWAALPAGGTGAPSGP